MFYKFILDLDTYMYYNDVKKITCIMKGAKNVSL